MGSLTGGGTGDRTFFNNGQQYGSGIQPIRGGEFEEGKTTIQWQFNQHKRKGLGGIQGAQISSSKTVRIVQLQILRKHMVEKKHTRIAKLIYKIQIYIQL